MNTEDRLLRRVERERKARKEAEMLLERKSLDLYYANQELQQLAADLMEKEERNRILLESTSEGIYATNMEGICTLCNPAVARMLGYDSPQQVIGKNAHQLFHHTRPDGSEYPEQKCLMLKGLKDEIMVGDELFWRADGTPLPVEYRSAPMKLNGVTMGLVVSFSDITERRAAELQLRHAQKLESIGQLAAGIAHEINTPTQFINDNTHFIQDAFVDYSRLLLAYERLIENSASGTFPESMLKEVRVVAEEIDINYLKDEIPQALEQSLEGLERVTRIVLAMKEFSHPGVKEKVTIDLNQAIRTTVDVSRNEWKYNAELTTELDPNLPQVPVLAGEFNQVILNLIVNSAHAIADVVGESGRMGKILITTRQDGEWVEIRVTDSGKGMAPEIQKRIFDPFFTTKEVGKGSGQGLAINWSVIVDKHGGTINVESEEDKGTTFTIRLPIT